jgi:16S rRNA (guanine527-N7)-methyltransferase
VLSSVFHVKHSNSSSTNSNQILSSHDVAQFRKVCSSFRIDLSDEMVDKFQAYLSLLLEWNKRIHLVSKGDARSDRILRHFVDSLSIFKAVDIPRNANLLDLGAGAGFPSIPMKIVREDVRLTLVESIHKKTLFLQKLSQVLKFENISIINQRAERLADQHELKEKSDVVVAKAMGKLKDVIGLSMPLLKTGGLFVAYKGKEVEGEIEQIGSLKDCPINEMVKIEIPEMDLLRWLVVIEKAG